MKVRHLHNWQVTSDQALEIQRRLASQVTTNNKVGAAHLIAGVDISGVDARGMARGAIVVLSYPELEPVESIVTEETVDFPYIPGLLSFREVPLLLAACEKLPIIPDLIMVDGQGIAHPRRIGLASHLGLFLDIPTIGCAKSRLCGSHGTVANEPGSWAELFDRDEVIGVALRTKTRSRPLYISIGHKVNLPLAIHWVLSCCRGYRLPEPTRLAHLAASRRSIEKNKQ